MPKEMAFGTEATKKILDGISKVTEAAAATLGPKGRNVGLENKYQSPTITNDGVTVIQAIELEDPFEQIGAKLVKEASSRTNEAFGDGTTTAAILTNEIARRGLVLLQAGYSPMLLKKGIDETVAAICEIIERDAIPVDDPTEIFKVAMVASNQDEAISNAILDAVEKMGTRGLIEIQDMDEPGVELELVDGYSFDRGYINEKFVRPGETRITMKDVAVLVMEQRFNSLRQFEPLINVLSQRPQPLLIVADDIEGDVLVTLLVNVARGNIQAVPVKAPGFGDNRMAMLGDIAILTGTAVVGPSRGLSMEKMLSEHGLGVASQVVVDRDSTIIIGGGGEEADIMERARVIRKAALDPTTTKYNKERLLKRASYLDNGVAVIRVGGTTELERKDRRLRADDALGATRAASEGGIVPGGGVALIHAAREYYSSLGFIEDRDIEMLPARELVIHSCSAPAGKIAQNAGKSADYTTALIADSPDGTGFNAQTMLFEDMRTSGIMDPAKVVTSALKFAASVAGMLLTVGCAVVETKEEE